MASGGGEFLRVVRRQGGLGRTLSVGDLVPYLARDPGRSFRANVAARTNGRRERTIYAIEGA